MHDNLLVGDDVLAVLVDELLVRGGTVHARGHEDAHARLRRRGVDAAKQDGHRHARGHGTRVVGADDDDVTLARAKLLELGRAVGVVEGVLDELLLALGRLEVILVALHEAGEVLVLETDGHRLVVIRQFGFEHGSNRFPFSLQTRLM